jgi:phosphoketolase
MPLFHAAAPCIGGIKHALPQWLNMDTAVVHCAEGVGIWQ